MKALSQPKKKGQPDLHLLGQALTQPKPYLCSELTTLELQIHIKVIEGQGPAREQMHAPPVSGQCLLFAASDVFSTGPRPVDRLGVVQGLSWDPQVLVFNGQAGTS